MVYKNICNDIFLSLVSVKEKYAPHFRTQNIHLISFFLFSLLFFRGLIKEKKRVKNNYRIIIYIIDSRMMKAIINFRIITIYISIIHDDENHRGRRVSDSNKCTPDIDTFYKRFPLKRSLPRHPCQSPNNLRQFKASFLQSTLIKKLVDENRASNY